MKSKNKRIDNVTWQKSYLSSNEKNEHNTAIQVYNIGGIKNGHLTSVCDSFLLLLCEVFCISITHNFMNTSIQYANLKKSRKPKVAKKINRSKRVKLNLRQNYKNKN